MNGYRGVAWDKGRNKWEARLKIGGKNYRLGRFDDEKEAARTWDVAALIVRGRGTNTNFPPELLRDVDVSKVIDILNKIGVPAIAKAPRFS